MNRGSTLLTALATAAISGCAAVGSTAAPVPSASVSSVGSESPVSRSERALVRVSATGDYQLEWSQEADVRILALTEGSAVRLLSVGFERFVELSPTEGFRTAFDLVGPYVGSAGTFEIPSDDVPVDGPRSGAFLLVAQVAAAGDEFILPNFDRVTEFRILLSPCVIDVADGEASGSLDCPRLGDGQGHIVHLRLEWDLLG